MPSAAIITGTGLVTPLGGCVDSTWQALLAGRAIRDNARAPSPSPSQGEGWGEGPGTRDGRRPFGISARPDPHRSPPPGREREKDSFGWAANPTPNALPFGSRLNEESRLFHIARRAAVAASSDRPIPDALVVGTSKGEADAWIADAFLPAAGIGNLAWQLGDALNVAGPRLTVSAACASGLHALIRGALLIAAGDAQRVLVVAAESSLHPMFLENYRRLGVLAPEGAGCRPFDRDRQGFCLSEAAAAVMLERNFAAEDAEDAVNNSPQVARIAVESFAFGSDATHLTGNDPTGRPLRNLLARVMAGRRFDLIHAHGTGTVANDAAELSALESVLSDDAGPAPLLYSHKAALGHSLGASGLVSVVLNAQMHRMEIVPGNVNTPHPLSARGVAISTQRQSRPIQRSLAIAAGFGGAMAAVSLKTTHGMR